MCTWRKNYFTAQLILPKPALACKQATCILILTNQAYFIHFYADLILKSNIKINFTIPDFSWKFCCRFSRFLDICRCDRCISFNVLATRIITSNTVPLLLIRLKPGRPKSITILARRNQNETFSNGISDRTLNVTRDVSDYFCLVSKQHL